LRDAEQRAGQLSDQAQRAADTNLSGDLEQANDRLADAAAKLRAAEDADDVRAALEDDLGPAVDRLTDAAGTLMKDDDARRQIEQARDRLSELRDQLPELAG
jgi:hypothetical protein